MQWCIWDNAEDRVDFAKNVGSVAPFEWRVEMDHYEWIESLSKETIWSRESLSGMYYDAFAEKFGRWSCAPRQREVFRLAIHMAAAKNVSVPQEIDRIMKVVFLKEGGT